jgi:predicted porin
MNKKFLTAAIAAALIAPTAAFADVTVYGKLHMSVDYTDTNTDPAATTNNVDKGNLGLSSNSSRIGFKGDEGLGGGLKAVWQIESGVNMDGKGTSTLGTRNTYLGLAGGFGTFLVGKHDTPFKMFGRSLDPFGDTIADTRQLTNIGGVWDLRPANVLAYVTPDFNGFKGVMAYVTGLDNAVYTDTAGATTVGGADNNKLTAVSLNGTYTNGPIYVGAAYESHNTKNAIGAAAGAENPSAWRLGGSYAFGPAKVGAMWQKVSNTDVTTTVDVNRTAWTLFGTYAFGMETVKLAYTQVGQMMNDSNGVADTDANLLALGIDHKLSKRTSAYAQYTALTNENAAQFALGGVSGYGDAVTPGVGKDPSAFSVGMIHKF